MNSSVLSCAIHQRHDIFSLSSSFLGGDMVMNIKHFQDFSYAKLKSIYPKTTTNMTSSCCVCSRYYSRMLFCVIKDLLTGYPSKIKFVVPLNIISVLHFCSVIGGCFLLLTFIVCFHFFAVALKYS